MKPGTYPRDHVHGGDRCRQAFRVRMQRNGGDRDKAIAELRTMGCDYSPRGSATVARRSHAPARAGSTPAPATFPPRRAEKPAAPAARDAAWWL